MTRKEAKELQEAFKHFVDGGNLWWYNPSSDKWNKQDRLMCSIYDFQNEGIINIIEDEHFEARKTYALGEEIEVSDNTNICDGSDEWVSADKPSWSNKYSYRPKRKEQAYEWQYIVRYHSIGNFQMTGYLSEEDVHPEYEKYEPSKRIKK